MDYKALIDRYIKDLEVEDVDYVPVDDCSHDAAYLLLNLPTGMLREYSRMANGNDNQLPDGVSFWRETGLGLRLQEVDRKKVRTHEPLADILEVLNAKGVALDARYQEFADKKRIRLSIEEMPERDLE
jgi:hypothetical protein